MLFYYSNSEVNQIRPRFSEEVPNSAEAGWQVASIREVHKKSRLEETPPTFATVAKSTTALRHFIFRNRTTALVERR